MKQVLFSQMSVDELKEIIGHSIQQSFQTLLATSEIQTKDEGEMLSRKDTAKLLKISLPTLHLLTKEGKVRGYRIGKRVLYKKSDIEKSLQEIHTKIYKNLNTPKL